MRVSERERKLFILLQELVLVWLYKCKHFALLKNAIVFCKFILISLQKQNLFSFLNNNNYVELTTVTLIKVLSILYTKIVKSSEKYHANAQDPY